MGACAEVHGEPWWKPCYRSLEVRLTWSSSTRQSSRGALLQTLGGRKKLGRYCFTLSRSREEDGGCRLCTLRPPFANLSPQHSGGHANIFLVVAHVARPNHRRQAFCSVVGWSSGLPEASQKKSNEPHEHRKEAPKSSQHPQAIRQQLAK